MSEIKNLMEMYKVAADRARSEVDRFFKRTTFFDAVFGLVVAGQAFLFRKISETSCAMFEIVKSNFLLIAILSVFGCIISILLGRIIANSAFWTDVFNRTLARLETAITRKKTVTCEF